MKKQKLLRLPIICDAGGDLSKNWFVEFYCRNPKNGKFERQKIYKGINIYHTNFDPRKAATEICDCYTDKIRNGWSPYIDNNEESHLWLILLKCCIQRDWKLHREHYSVILKLSELNLGLN